MLIKSKNKRVTIGLTVLATCIVVAGLWAALAIPGTALAKIYAGAVVALILLARQRKVGS